MKKERKTNLDKAIEEIRKVKEADEAILSSPEHCEICNCNCGCHPCKHTGEYTPYFPSDRT